MREFSGENEQQDLRAILPEQVKRHKSVFIRSYTLPQ
jgi:hypothetical protein